jgi:hypothetical protein
MTSARARLRVQHLLHSSSKYQMQAFSSSGVEREKVARCALLVRLPAVLHGGYHSCHVCECRSRRFDTVGWLARRLRRLWLRLRKGETYHSMHEFPGG